MSGHNKKADPIELRKLMTEKRKAKLRDVVEKGWKPLQPVKINFDDAFNRLCKLLLIMDHTIQLSLHIC